MKAIARILLWKFPAPYFRILSGIGGGLLFCFGIFAALRGGGETALLLILPAAACLRGVRS